MKCTPKVRQCSILKLTLGVLIMPKGEPNKQYTAEFKKQW